MKYESRQDRLANSYRKVEAMWRHGLTVDEITRSSELSRMDVLDIVQKIFAMDQRRMRRAC